MRIPRHPAIFVADMHVVHRMMMRSSRHEAIAPAEGNPSAGIAHAPHPGIMLDRFSEKNSLSCDGIGRHFLPPYFIGTLVEPYAVHSYLGILRAAWNDRSRRWLLSDWRLRCGLLRRLL